MMKITVNGKETVLEREVNIKELLQRGYVEMQEYVTVQVNDSIIPRDSYDNYMIKEGDIIEFLYYMGGGNRESDELSLSGKG
jgi:sulfur carrier protein